MKVVVYNNHKPIGVVEHNTNLDVWDGTDFSNGGRGNHLGITKLKTPIDGKIFVLLYGSNWSDVDNYGVLVSDEEAKDAILKAQKYALFKYYFGEMPILEEERQ